MLLKVKSVKPCYRKMLLPYLASTAAGIYHKLNSFYTLLIKNIGNKKIYSIIFLNKNII